MPQLPLSIACGTLSPTVPDCPNGRFADVDANGLGILYADTRTLSLCKPVVTYSGVPYGGNSWNPQARPRYPLGVPDAADPRATSVSGGVYASLFPFPPHCWGWEGASDYLTIRYYDFDSTNLVVAGDGTDYAQFDGRYLSIQADYDVTVTRRMTRRKLTYTRANSFSATFDFSSPASDVCTDLAGPTTVTTHHTDVIHSNLSHGTVSNSDIWNVSTLGNNAFEFDPLGTGHHYGFRATDSQNSAYWDASVTDGQTPGAGQWGTFTEGYGFDPNSIGGNNLLVYEVVYTFGRETILTTNVRFTVTSAWMQYKCIGAPGPTVPPCNCNQDCPPCTGSNSVKSGHCATFCASGGISTTLIQGYTLHDQNGLDLTAPRWLPSQKWSVTQSTKCTLTVCAPCLTSAQKKAGDYAGPYSLTWGSGELCNCEGVPQYKTYSVSFTLEADVICPSTIPPDAGSSPSYDVDFSGRHARGFVAIPAGSVGGELKVGTASNVFPLVWNDVKTGIPASAVSLRWHRQQGQAWLYALVQQGLGMKLFISHDDGQKFDAGRIIATNGGGIPCLVICRDGRIICFAGAGQNNTVFDSVLNPIGHVDVGPATPYHVDEYVGAGTNWRFTTFSLSYDGVVQVGQSADGSAWTYKDAGKGLHPTGIVCADGRRIAYYVRDDGGSDGINIWGRMFDATGIPSGDEFKAVRGVDKDSIAADESVAGDVWHATLLFVVQGKLTCKTSTDGVVFTD